MHKSSLRRLERLLALVDKGEATQRNKDEIVGFCYQWMGQRTPDERQAMYTNMAKAIVKIENGK